jgi:hypothetical protein
MTAVTVVDLSADVQRLIGGDAALALRVKEAVIKIRKFRRGCLRRLWWREDGGPAWGFEIPNGCIFFGDSPAAAYKAFCEWAREAHDDYRGPTA